MADAPDVPHLNTVPSMPPAPYDACTDADAGPWVKSGNSGPADMQGNVHGDWPGSPPWRQT